jgi:predicted alpha-1,6-mannanase (GH76 family)
MATPPKAVTMSSPAPALPATTALADNALASFLKAYWDPDRRYFTTYSDRQRHPEHAFGPADALYSDFWWEAQLWDLVMDAHERTGGHEELVHAVYDGFATAYPTFLNDYNDDVGWWAQGSARAYELTGQVRYLERARELLDSIWEQRDPTGGIWWRRSVRDQRNVATNGPAAITAVKIYAATGDTQYLDRAQTLYSWIKSNLQWRGQVYDRLEHGVLVKTNHTYNAGNYIGAATALYGVTRDGSYLSDALSAADWVASQPYADGVLPYEGVGDGAGFKPILVRHLHRLAVELGQPQYLPFLRHNADAAWRNRRTSDGLIGPDWNSPAPSGPLQSLTAGAGAALLQIVAL